MTRRQKCVVCRLRKVKCDEKKPSCGQCNIKGRLCGYISAKPAQENSGSLAFRMAKTTTSSIRVQHDRPRWPVRDQNDVPVLRLQASSNAPEGSGAFHTLVSSRPSMLYPRHLRYEAPCRPLSNAETLLGSRWSHMIGNRALGSCSFQILGNWSALVPPRIGSHTLLDLAATYVLDSHGAYKQGDETKIDSVLKSATRVMKALRKLLMSQPHRRDDTTLIAISLLYAAEVFRGIGTFNFSLHMVAVSRMLNMRWASGVYGELDEGLLRSTCFEQICEAVFVGRSSAFDVALRPRDPKVGAVPQRSEFALASNLVIERLAQVPNLVRLARDSFREPDNAALAQQVVDLAEQMYDLGSGPDIEQAINKLTTVVETRPNPVAPPLAHSFQFSSIHAFTLTVYYHTYKLIICGILERIFELQTTPPLHLSRSAVESDDEAAAENIAKCVQYAFSYDSDVPLATLRILNPMVLSWGSWERCEKRLRMDHSTRISAQDRAVQMRQYSAHIVSHIAGRWNGRTMPYEFLEMICQAYAGGPCIPWASRQRLFKNTSQSASSSPSSSPSYSDKLV